MKVNFVRKHFRFARTLVLVVVFLAMCLGILTGCGNSGNTIEISEKDAAKMVELVNDIANMDAQDASAEEVYTYLDSLDWVESVRYEDDGNISCRTTFGVTAVWAEENDEYISSISLNSDDDSLEEHLQIIEKYAGDGLDIVILCPYASTDGNFIIDGYKDMGDKIAEEVSGSVTVIKDDDVSLECLKSLNEYDMVFFYSHGCLSSALNSAWALAPSDPYTMTGEFADSAELYTLLSSDFFYGRTVVNLSSGRIGIGGNFYTYYYESGDLEKMFFHFGSCYSMHTSTICDALLSLGAAWVEGWSDSVTFENDFMHMYGMGACLLSGYSTGKSVDIIISDKEVQKYAQENCNFVTVGDDTYQITVNRDSLDNIFSINGISNYTWVVEPTIEADDIYYLADYPDEKRSINELSKQADNSNAVIQRGNELGIIDLDGKLLTEVAYREIANFGDSYMMIRTVPEYSEEYNMDWDIYWLNKDGKVSASVGNGELNTTVYYYYNGIRQRTGNIYSDFVQEVIPVQESSVYHLQNLGLIINSLSGKYALEYNCNLITDFIYDECGSGSDGLFAVCQNGKWGYVDEQGQVVIPIEYDASWQQYPVFDMGSSRSSSKVKEYCYAASDGYVVLCQDGEWELKDITGNSIIPKGTFEAIRPVFDRRCWVKKDGKWGVIQVATESNEDQGWKHEYASILTNWRTIENYYDTSYIANYFGSDYQFDEYFLYDLNKDSVPELFLYSTTMGLTEVFTYSDSLVWCGENDFIGIQTVTNELIVQGHWHGAGGSGVYEWSSYSLVNQLLECTVGIDILGDRYAVYQYGNDVEGTEENYYSLYDQHFSNYTPYDSFSRYILADARGLDVW